MSEERTVPAFYPDFTDADTWKRWDGSMEAEMWARLQQLREKAIVDSAVWVESARRASGKSVDVGGVVSALWATGVEDANEIMTIIHEHQEEIERRAQSLDIG